MIESRAAVGNHERRSRGASEGFVVEGSGGSLERFPGTVVRGMEQGRAEETSGNRKRTKARHGKGHFSASWGGYNQDRVKNMAPLESVPVSRGGEYPRQAQRRLGV